MAPRYALIVGISKYKSLPDLSKPAIDAAAVKQRLEECGGFQDIRLLQDVVTLEALENALIELLRVRAVGAEAFIYFTGHGFVVQEGQRKQRPYFATSDCQVTFDRRDRRQIVGQLYGYSFESFNELVQESTVSSLVVLLDCCHSGALLALAKQHLAAFNALDKDYFLIAACRSFEKASAYTNQPHSIFTGAVLDGLQQDNADPDGQITSDRLYDYIRQQLVRSEQEPIRMGTGRAITLVNYHRRAGVTQIDETCPYQGLEPFTEATQQFFFGRKPVVERLRQELERSPFVALIGASGSGKSSVVRAGLIPWAKEAGWRVLAPIKPGFEPLSELKRALASPFRRRAEIEQVYGAIAASALDTAVSLLPGTEQILLVVDQFEEAFTVCADEVERRSFIDLITQLRSSRLKVVITMRADFLEPCLDYISLTQQLQQHTVLIPPLEGDALEEAIVKPAQQQGYRVEAALLRLIQRDVAQERNCLPLLQFALQVLWDTATQVDHQLMLDHYEQLGGIAGALNRHADRVYDYQDWREITPTQARSSQEQDCIKRLCLKLVRTGDGTRDTRQRQPKANLLALASGEATQAILEVVLADLIDGRLLVTDQAEMNYIQSETITSSAYVDLAHEALLDGWARFAEWRNENRELRQLVDRLEDVRREWEQHQRNPDFLLSKGLLVQLDVQSEQLQPYMTSALRKFYQISKDKERERDAAIEWARSEGALNARADDVIQLLHDQPLQGLAFCLQLVKRNLENTSDQLFGKVHNSLYQAVDMACECHLFQGHQAAVSAIAFSPDGQMIVSSSEDRTIRLWNLNGDLVNEPFLGHQGWVTSVAFSPDGQTIVSGSEDGTIRVWDLNGTPIGQPFKGHQGWIMSVAFSPNGQTIVSSSSDRTLRLWDLHGNLIGHPFVGHKAPIRSVAVSPDGQYIVSGSYDRTIRLWDLNGNLMAKPFTGHKAAVRSVVFSPDGQRLLSGSQDGTLRLWTLDGTPLEVDFSESTSTKLSLVNAVAFSPSGQVIVSSHEDGVIRLWSLQGKLLGHPLVGHESAVTTVKFSPDGQILASGSVDQSIRLWAIHQKAIGQPLLGHQVSSNSLIVFSPDDQTLVDVGTDNTVRIWNRRVSAIGRVLIKHENAVSSVAFSPDGKTIASNSVDGKVRLWNVEGNLVGQAQMGPDGEAPVIAFSPDGRRIARAGRGSLIWLWDIQTNSINRPFEGHQRPVWSVAFSPNGKLIASGSYDQTVRVWNLEGYQIKQPFQGHTEPVLSVGFSPDGTRIVSGSQDRTIRLWDLEGNKIGHPFKGHELAINSVTFSPDGKMIVSGSDDRTIRLWNLNGEQIGRPFQGHESFVTSVAFSPDSKLIVSGSADCTVRLWDLEGKLVWQSFERHHAWVKSVAFSLDGQLLASGGQDGGVYLWRWNTWEDWLAICCDRIRYHPYFKNPQTEEARAACDVCEKYVWSRERSV